MNPNKKIIIYGAGKIGKQYYRFFEFMHREYMIYAFCDREYKQIKQVGTVPVYSYQELRNKGLVFVIGVMAQEEIVKCLKDDNQLYYNNLEGWIKDYHIDDVERIKMRVIYHNMFEERDDNEGVLDNLDSGLSVELEKLELDKAVRVYKGICPVCREKTLFISRHYWLRDHYKCLFCRSIPRQRGIMRVLADEMPEWREKIIHESSPGGSTLRIFRQECRKYSYSYWYEEKKPGEILGERVTNQNLENMTFKDEMFDIFITQDVLEHVNRPEKVFSEIARVLKKGGIHIFTTPMYPFEKTKCRIQMLGDTRKMILPPIYHNNPIDSGGSLVTYEWGGYDFLEWIDNTSGMRSKVVEFPNSKENFENGLEGDFLQVIVSRKI